MLRGSVAGRRHAELARISLGIGDELVNGRGWDRRMHHDYARYPHDANDRSDVPDEIKIEICVECGVDRARGVYLEKRIAIGGCLHHRLGTDIATSPRPVLNDK